MCEMNVRFECANFGGTQVSPFCIRKNRKVGDNDLGKQKGGGGNSEEISFRTYLQDDETAVRPAPVFLQRGEADTRLSRRAPEIGRSAAGGRK